MNFLISINRTLGKLLVWLQNLERIMIFSVLLLSFVCSEENRSISWFTKTKHLPGVNPAYWEWYTQSIGGREMEFLQCHRVLMVGAKGRVEKSKKCVRTKCQHQLKFQTNQFGVQTAYWHESIWYYHINSDATADAQYEQKILKTVQGLITENKECCPYRDGERECTNMWCLNVVQVRRLHLNFLYIIL